MNRRHLAIGATVALVLGAFLLWVNSAYTQDGSSPRLASPAGVPVPHLINYQGRLTDLQGRPREGDHYMRFCIYDVASGGTALWCEPSDPTTRLKVLVKQGVFSVLLGGTNPIPAIVFDVASSDRWLGVQIDPDTEEMDPRRRIASVGYAYRAEDANRAQDADNADTVDGLHASSVPEPDTLFPLDASRRFTNTVLYTGHNNGLDADAVDGIHASSTATANSLLALDDSGKFTNTVLYTGHSNGLDADTVDGLHASDMGGPTTVVYAGHADISSHADVTVTEKVYFHSNAAPTGIKLYLWGEKFSPFFYTELGQHSHAPGDIYIPHDHAVCATANSETGTGANLGTGTCAWSVNRITDSGGPTGTPTGNTDSAGVLGGTLSSAAKDWLDHMQVWIDGVDRTADVLALTPLTEFGDGTEGHAFNTDIGSGEMDITSLVSYTGPRVFHKSSDCPNEL